MLVVDPQLGDLRAAWPALVDQTLFGRPLVVLQAHSIDDARQVLLREHERGHDVSVVMLDLTSGLPASGLVRQVAALADTRVILICDDSSPPPGLDALLAHDISDWRRRQELTGDRLLTIIAAALRSHEQLRLLRRVRDDAYYDPLVRLPNRAHFVEQVDRRVRKGGAAHVLALLDIDDFSAANEVMGHGFGDCLLETVARCLAEAMSPDVLLARVGSDTFGVLGPVDDVHLERLLDCVRKPLTVEEVPYNVSLTCGYVLLSGHAQTGADLVKDATIALKRAKRDHRGQHVQYLGHMGTEARARAVLLADLRVAIDESLLFLVYQPQIDLASGALVGLEALSRWRTAAGELVPPDQFIPVAEHSGLIVALGRWVLGQACSTMRRLLDIGLAPPRMAINVSMVQLRDPAFVDTVNAALSASGLQGRHLELEITESVAVLPTQMLEATLSALRTQGISIAIDDFGTGYSSLSCLERLPLDRIKIDRAFVSLLGEAHGARIAEMVTQLGRNMGLQVLAEGIEDETTLQALLSIGCQQGQGFHIARPMEEAALTAWLAGRLPSRA